MSLEMLQKVKTDIIRKGTNPHSNTFELSSLFMEMIHFKRDNIEIDIKSFSSPSDMAFPLSPYRVFLPLVKNKRNMAFISVINSIPELGYKTFFFKDFDFFLLALTDIKSKNPSTKLYVETRERRETLFVTIESKGRALVEFETQLYQKNNQKNIKTDIYINNRYVMVRTSYDSKLILDQKTLKHYNYNDFNDHYYKMMNSIDPIDSWIYNCPFE